MTGSTTTLNQDGGQIFNLLLGTTESSQSLLGELTGALVLVVLQQFHATLLVGGEAGNLTDEFTDKLDALTKSLNIRIRNQT